MNYVSCWLLQITLSFTVISVIWNDFQKHFYIKLLSFSLFHSLTLYLCSAPVIVIVSVCLFVSCSSPLMLNTLFELLLVVPSAQIEKLPSPVKNFRIYGFFVVLVIMSRPIISVLTSKRIYIVFIFSFSALKFEII